jgi:hypothetical protein
MPRRSFLAAVGGSAVGSAALAGCATTGAAKSAAVAECRPCPAVGKKELVVQPVLSYQLFTRGERTSWRPWGGFHSQEDIDAEAARINKELEEIKSKSEFPLTFLPLAKVRSKEDAQALVDSKADVMFIYGATGDLGPLEMIISPSRYNIMFLRHKSGPVYLWYETTSCRMLRKTVDELGQPGLMPWDVVVDNLDDVTWRLRSLFALKNTVGSRIVAIGDASGWGGGGQKAPQIAADLWKLDIVPVSYDDLKKRIESFRADTGRVGRATEDAHAYLKQSGVTLTTDKGFVERAFMLTEVFRDLMKEMNSPAITINNCMSAIMPVSDTTACMPLSLINDSGALAFCESDFVVIPSGILLNHICQTPVFLNDPTYPHDGIITCAHCTAPGRMDGKHLEKVNILTHYESDFGAAPKVDMKLGQEITMIDPDFASKRWLGFRGRIVDNPFMDICRSQVDVTIEGDWEKLAELMCGFHWMMAYGDHRKEIGYALRKMGIEWLDFTAEKEKQA